MTIPLHRSAIFTPPSRNPKLVNWPPSENCNAKLNLSEAKLIISDKLQFLNDKYRILHGGSTDMDFFPSGINNIIRNERNEWVTIVCCSSWLINFWVCRALLCDVKTEATVQHFHATLAFKLFKSGKIQVITFVLISSKRNSPMHHAVRSSVRKFLSVLLGLPNTELFISWLHMLCTDERLFSYTETLFTFLALSLNCELLSWLTDVCSFALLTVV